MSGSGESDAGSFLPRRTFSDEVGAHYETLVLRAEECLRDSMAEKHMEAQDLLHFALLHAQEVFDTFDPGVESFVRWMTAIIQDRADGYSEVFAREMQAVEAYLETRLSESPKETSKRIRGAIARACGEIPLRYRKATVMYFLGGHSADDIAIECKLYPWIADFQIKKGQEALQNDPELRALWKELKGDDADD